MCTVRIWNVETGKVQRTWEGHECEVAIASFSPDGQQVVMVPSDNIAQIRNAETGEEQRTLGYQSGVAIASFSPDGQRVTLRR